MISQPVNNMTVSSIKDPANFSVPLETVCPSSSSMPLKKKLKGNFQSGLGEPLGEMGYTVVSVNVTSVVRMRRDDSALYRREEGRVRTCLYLRFVILGDFFYFFYLKSFTLENVFGSKDVVLRKVN